MRIKKPYLRFWQLNSMSWRRLPAERTGCVTAVMME